MSSSVALKEMKDLTEIDAHYYSDFTVSADGDLTKLLRFLQAYISASDELIPDVSLSVSLDQDVILKNVCLTKLDIHSCKEDILANSCDIVAILGLSALKRTRGQFDVQEILKQLDQKMRSLSYLKDMILNEHGIDLTLVQDHVVDIS